MAGGRGFLDKRLDFREAVEAGVAVIGGGVFPLVNWSRHGFLVAGWEGGGAPGDGFEAGMSLLAGGRRHEFRAAAAVVRVEAAGRMAARFVGMDAAVRAAVDRHFDLAATLRETVGGRAYSEMPAASRPSSAVGDRDLPVPAAQAGDGAENGVASLPPGLRRLGPEQRAAVSDLLFTIKIAFARRCHPDAAPAQDAAAGGAVRARIFAEFWAEIGRIERALAASGRISD
ncbi:hypothetical protein [Arenibaculum sp.]|jgi:hypothetical protein|uniref:hypothetical protein n=1 Tax=Arenibaculum sp. TaxID=2865862 RepID=UPI002E11C40F|nr:hypothetical protein [Arenibaculum sp.]